VNSADRSRQVHAFNRKGDTIWVVTDGSQSMHAVDRRVDISWVVTAASVLLLVSDLSLLSLVLPLFAFGFTLVSQQTPRAYWQVMSGAAMDHRCIW